MRMMDMTEGNSAKEIFAFSVPLLIGNLFQQIYGVADTMVAGYNLGDHAIAAIGATGTLVGLIIDMAFGLNSGFAVLVTQKFGAKETEQLKRSIAGSILLNLAAAILITGVLLVFLHPLLRFLKVPAGIYDDAYRYSFVIFAGIAATICFNLFSGILRAVGNSITPLYFLIFSCAANILLDVWMIMGLHLGVTGAALATVCAQALSAGASGFYLWKNYRAILPGREQFVPDRGVIRGLASIGCSMALMYSVVDIGAIVLQAACNGLGEVYIIADIAASKVIIVLMVPLISFTSAASTFVGQNYGARKPERIRRGMWQAAAMELGWSLAATILSFAFGDLMIRLITGTANADVVRFGVLKLNCYIPFYPLLGVLFVLRISMQSMGVKLVPAVSSFLEMGIKWVTAVWLVPVLGYFAACVCTPVIWLVMTVYLALSYLRKRTGLYKTLEAPDKMEV